jgi:hypothetical protein
VVTGPRDNAHVTDFSHRPRVIETNFSFGFGAIAFAPPPAPTNEPPRKESPAKRQKGDHDTAVEVKTVAVQEEAQQAVPVAPVAPKPSKGVKGAKKSKRRLPVDVEEAPATPAEGDDSFVAQAKAKKPRTKRKHDGPVEVVGDVEVAAETLPSRGRPKRAAAASAATKVAEDLAEEEAPIDKKRRDPVPKVAPRKSRKKVMVDKAVGEDEVALVPVPEAPVDAVKEDEPLEQPQVPPKARREPVRKGRAAAKAAPTRKRKVNHVDAEEPLAAAAPLEDADPGPEKPGADAPSAATEATKGEKDVHPAEPQKRTTRKPRAAPRKAPTRKGRKAADERQLVSEDVDVDDVAVPSRAQKSVGKPSAIDSPSKRVPLGKADANIVRQSVSPSKLEKVDHNEPAPALEPKPRKRTKDVMPAEEEESVKDAKAPASAPAKKSKASSRKAPTKRKAEPPSDHDHGDDDGMEWLLAPPDPPDPKPPPPPPAKNSKATSSRPTKRQDFTKLSDVSLDDLVANITYFAPTPHKTAAPSRSQASGRGTTRAARRR